MQITPLILPQLPISRVGLTEFTYSRFLTPWLCDFKGVSLFLDPDTLVLCDIYELMEHYSPLNAVTVVNTEPAFERASLMLFSNSLCTRLTPEWINDEDHNPFNLRWAGSVGELPKEYNHLVLYDEPNPDAKIIHFTCGIPCFPETQDHEYGVEWRWEMQSANNTVTWREIMGSSVHVERVLKRLKAA